MILTSKQNSKIKELSKLKETKYRKLTNEFLIEGYHLVEEAIKKDIVLEIFEANESLKYPDSIQVSQDIIKKLSSTKTPQPIVARCKKMQANNKLNKVLALNNVQDPGNIGTMIRLAYAFGFDTVVVENTDIYNSKIIRSSQGAFFNLNLIETKDLASYLISLKTKGFKVYSTILDLNAKKLNDVAFEKEQIIVVMGNEGQGISDTVKQLSDVNLYIPIEFESLNVACAAAIILNKIKNN
ncbi:RNA methyltransferase [Mycoplasma sp. NEAQ87857]|uniref:TrmH family RNA methyltransferase n=1 Tax=Mycoplasma sp. NEAQ87857 TaxID=2683967 RepID=UPI001317F1F1|nr:RNA methyltransferase [Mycoplasma sp. NEAQ87857]QGZ97325.1 RNA methyltransferase [Mycoplasma sp. NEAQ87857]